MLVNLNSPSEKFKSAFALIRSFFKRSYSKYYKYIQIGSKSWDELKQELQKKLITDKKRERTTIIVVGVVILVALEIMKIKAQFDEIEELAEEDEMVSNTPIESVENKMPFIISLDANPNSIPLLLPSESEKISLDAKDFLSFLQG